LLWLCGWFLAAGTASLTAAQDSAPLGDYARQVRKQKAQTTPAGKTFDNDTLPKDDKLSVVGQAPAEQPPPPGTNGEPTPAAELPSSDGGSVAATAPADGQGPAKADKQGDQADDRAEKQKMYQDWHKRIHGQQEQVDLVGRELEVLNREYRLRAAAFYADAGNRLRNSGAWDKEDAQYKEQIANKQKALDDAKAKLDDLQEQARKAGVPSSMRE